MSFYQASAFPKKQKSHTIHSFLSPNDLNAKFISTKAEPWESIFANVLPLLMTTCKLVALETRKCISLVCIFFPNKWSASLFQLQQLILCRWQIPLFLAFLCSSEWVSDWLKLRRSVVNWKTIGKVNGKDTHQLNEFCCEIDWFSHPPHSPPPHSIPSDS